ncbi:CidA/LrgA family protein [Stappia sp.]|uniref:CidA/LrgA family protein n=1 Tax=Stappia sp. TaxID=1870903 RepID=UPI003D09ED6C
MLSALTLILCCQLAGELLVEACGLPVPGPVVGMVLLFAWLMLRKREDKELAATADALLRNLALLFVPAGVGVVLHLGLIGREGIAISAALIVSTLATVAVTALVMQWTLRGEGGGKGETGTSAKGEGGR